MGSMTRLPFSKLHAHFERGARISSSHFLQRVDRHLNPRNLTDSAPNLSRYQLGDLSIVAPYARMIAAVEHSLGDVIHVGRRRASNPSIQHRIGAPTLMARPRCLWTCPKRRYLNPNGTAKRLARLYLARTLGDDRLIAHRLSGRVMPAGSGTPRTPLAVGRAWYGEANHADTRNNHQRSTSVGATI